MRVDRWARRLVLFGAPAAAAVVELFHPRVSPANLVGDGSGVLATWLAVHVVQLFLFGLMAWAALLLLDGQHGPLAGLARFSLVSFAVIYGAYDALAGIGSGILALNAANLPAGEQTVIAASIRTYFATVENGGYAWIGVLGACLWVAGLFIAAVVLARPRYAGPALAIGLLSAATMTLGAELVWRPFGILGLALFLVALVLAADGGRSMPGVVLLLGISAWMLKAGHPAPTGTIAFASFLLAALWYELAGGRLPQIGWLRPRAVLPADGDEPLSDSKAGR
jgi:hypothetical protein